MSTGDSPCNLCRSLTRLPVDIGRKELRGRRREERTGIPLVTGLDGGLDGITPVVEFQEVLTPPLVGKHAPETVRFVSPSAATGPYRDEW